MRLQSTPHGLVSPIWMVWLVAAVILNCTAEDYDDDYVPPYEYECANPCEDGSFCGRDLQCHFYSCDNWYTLANSTMTGYVPGKSPALSCEIVEDERIFLGERPLCGNGFPTAVSFASGCDGASLPCWDGATPIAHFNRKCTSTPNDGLGFVCFDMAPTTDTDTYFENFITATADLDAEPCTEYNETAPDPYAYATFFAADNIISIGSFSGLEFNATLAMKTLNAKLFEFNVSETLFPFCENGCKTTEFCGQDGTCHEFNCVNMYEYGPTSATGHDFQDASAPELECSTELSSDDPSQTCWYSDGLKYRDDFTSTIESPWPLAIRFHCSVHETYPSSSRLLYLESEDCAYSYLDGRYATFNRYCSAQPNPHQNFTCFDIDPDTDIETYLSDYSNKTTMKSECTEDNLPYPLNPDEYEGENVTSIRYTGYHEYSTCILRVTADGSRKDCTIIPIFAGWNKDALSPIDFERLRFVMQSKIVGNVPVEEESSSFARQGVVVRTHMIVAVGMFATIGWIIVV